MKKRVTKIVRKTVGANLVVALTFLLLPVLLFTNDIEVYKSAIEFLNKD